MGREAGQATIEWTGVVLVVALALGALVTLAPAVDGRSLGALLAHRLVCAVRGGCDDGEGALAHAYGDRDAELVRRHAPGIAYEPGVLTLPVDPRECRSHRCSDAPDDRALDVGRSARTGSRATAFTHVVRRGGRTYIQYWLYYPDSTSTAAGLAGLWNRAERLRPFGRRRPYPGYHRDDWESYQVRIDRDGRVSVRASSHKGYQWCKQSRCSDRWGTQTGWTRVSRGSHAGHIPLHSERHDTRIRLGRSPLRWPVRSRYRYEPRYPGVDLEERTTAGARLRLVPLESFDRRGYRPLDAGITPPWKKEVYKDPESDSTA